MQLQHITTKIHEIRGMKVMLDYDLAILYEVETRSLKQAVRRNSDRFPEDFMFQLTEQEIDRMVSQIVIPSKSYFGGAKPFAFTQEGISMLSSVLRSKKAVLTNISIMRAFVMMRQFALSHRELTEKLKEMETKYDQHFHTIYEAIDYLMKNDEVDKKQKSRRRIGYK